ncbi:MAG: T9SS type A sorting domain-containing protein [Ferruginibacter sp.]
MKSKIIEFIPVLLLSTALKAQPPNNTIFFGSTGDGFTKALNVSTSNAIFAGGAGDGFTRSANVSASNNIFVGGFGDGWSTAINTTASNTIFIGGIGDGWHTGVNTTVPNTIFIGGIGDGWNNAGNTTVSNSIFKGGNGDGWNKNANAAVSNNIFLGGIGDGWASVYRPMAPLPVNFLYFNVSKQGKSIALLNWKTAQEFNASHFEIERSTDALIFSYIGKVTAVGNTSTGSTYSFTDNAPAKGFDYYRLKQVDRDGRFTYTPARVLNFDDLDAGSVKYYPNPVNRMLNIELTDEIRSQQKWFTLSNTGGEVLDQVKIAANSDRILILDLGKYPKGIYFIQLSSACCNSTQRIVIQ